MRWMLLILAISLQAHALDQMPLEFRKPVDFHKSCAQVQRDQLHIMGKMLIQKLVFEVGMTVNGIDQLNVDPPTWKFHFTTKYNITCDVNGVSLIDPQTRTAMVYITNSVCTNGRQKPLDMMPIFRTENAQVKMLPNCYKAP